MNVGWNVIFHGSCSERRPTAIHTKPSQAKTIKPNATTAIMTATTICKSVIGDSSKAAKQQVSQPASQAGRRLNSQSHHGKRCKLRTPRNYLRQRHNRAHTTSNKRHNVPPYATWLKTTIATVSYHPDKITVVITEETCLPPTTTTTPSPNKLHKSYITLADP